MAKKAMMWKTKGMNRDLSVSAFSPEFAFENMNLRLSTNEGNTQMSWVSERGTRKITYEAGSDELVGLPIGTAVIDHQLVLFTTEYSGENFNSNNDDHIYLLKYTDKEASEMSCRQLCQKPMNFSAQYPLETLVSYESETIQKVYWTDGRNQPRLINIALPNIGELLADKPSTYFDFVPALKLQEEVTVEKNIGVLGTFAAGVIQYSFTYFNKNGQETGIFYTTPLLYISYSDRGGSPDAKINNAFTIKINKVDKDFDYIRIYSIQRTSINATPLCKRVHDISLTGITGNSVSYIDTGENGDSVDPTELLYKGGNSISAKTMAHKDSTLFFGNLHILQPYIIDYKSAIQERVSITSGTRTLTCSNDVFQLSAKASRPGAYYNGSSTPCGGFKTGNYYRLGVQFQHESGKWSDPIHIMKADTIDHLQDQIPLANGTIIQLPNFKGELSNTGGQLFDSLRKAGYLKVRPVVVFPTGIDRDVVCQAVATPALQFGEESGNSTMHYSSWFFRPYRYISEVNDKKPESNDTAISPCSWRGGTLEYYVGGNMRYIRQQEVEGTYGSNSAFTIDMYYHTFHSPDVEFDTQLHSLDYNTMGVNTVGTVTFTHTYADIDIQTETPSISDNGGFDHQAIAGQGPEGIVTGLFYEDSFVDDDENAELRAFDQQKSPARFFIYPWQGTGSLNNDCARPAGKGIQSAKLKKKVISNYRDTETELWNYQSSSSTKYSNPGMQLFSGEDVEIRKLPSNHIYMGNIDTALMPNSSSPIYTAYSGVTVGTETDIGTPSEGLEEYTYTVETHSTVSTSFNSSDWCKIDNTILYKYIKNEGWKKGYDKDGIGYIGDAYKDLSRKKLPVRMRYKSTPHFIGRIFTSSEYRSKVFSGKAVTALFNKLFIVEVCHSTDKTVRYGGYSEDALCANSWVPCGEPVVIPEESNASSKVTFYYDYGDSYFQKWDCLKTYAFTPEDINQVIEIGSFRLTTYINIDGRYDRNRAQFSNLNMSPTNFNLMNMVYSQTDNFFSYKILPESTYSSDNYPNQITWTLAKQSGADVDEWTHLTLATNLELDGDKGEINSLLRFNDSIICFQDSGLSQVLYNETAAITTTEGVPIEIGNSGKVQGKKYISDSIGCRNKWSIVQTPIGIYFMDSNERSIYRFSGQLQNISIAAGFNSWCKQNIHTSEVWNTENFGALNGEGTGAFVSYYDRQNQDVLFINRDIALAYSEKLGIFTSFYSYGNAQYLCNLDDTGIWIKGEESISLWNHQASDEYCSFFDEVHPYSMTLVGNPEPLTDKIFTNLEFRACVDGEGVEDVFDESFDDSFHSRNRFIPYLPFNKLSVWNEYQEGHSTLSNMRGSSLSKHHTSDNNSSLIRKFRIWRCDIPRDNTRRSDRMRNPWIYLKLEKDSDDVIRRAEIHDMTMTYFV